MASINKKIKKVSKKSKSTTADNVAIVGMSCRFPGADNYNKYWDNLIGGVNSIAEIPKNRWDTDLYYSEDITKKNKSVSKWCGLVDNIDKFDNRFFDISPREANCMDPQQRLLLEEAFHCIEDSGIPLSILQSKKTSVFIGAMAMDYIHESSKPESIIDNYAGTGNYECILANRISHYFQLRGKSYSIDAACASSLIALHEAKKSLLSGESDFALVGGVSLNFHPWKYITWSKSRMLSPDGQCRTFDKDANGYVPGDGVGVVLLQRKTDSLKLKSNIYAILKGSAVNHCGKALSMTTPSVDAQKDVILTAYNDANISPNTLNYVEAHGTGTSLGDPIEVEALTRAFREYTQKKQYCKIASVKSNIGHLEASAGIAGVIKILLMMKHKQIPQSLNIKTLNPIIQWSDTPFEVAREKCKWNPIEDGLELRASVSSFGIGGINSHVILESFSQNNDIIKDKKDNKNRDSYPFLLSAKSQDSLLESIENWKKFILGKAFVNYSLGDMCKTLVNSKGNYSYRLGENINSRGELADYLNRVSVDDIKHNNEKVELLIGNIEWTGFGDIQELYRSIELFREEVDKILLHVKDYKKFNHKAFHNKNWDKTDRIFYSIIVACALINTLFQMGYKPSLVYGNNKNFIILLLVCGVISARDAWDIIMLPKAPLNIKLKKPTIAFYDYVNNQSIIPFEFSKEYIKSLTQDLEINNQSIIEYIEKARLLFNTQFTFKRYLEEWNIVLQSKSMNIEALLFDENILNEDETFKKLVLLLAILSSLKRLNKKWNLTEKERIKEKRIYEIVDLIVDEVIDMNGAIELIANDEIDCENIVKAMNQNQSKIDLSSSYSILKEHNLILDKSPSWIKKALACEIDDYHKTKSNTLEIDKSVYDVSSAKELFSCVLLKLWKEGIDLKWDKIYPANTYQKVCLPQYIFDYKSFWVKFDKSAITNNNNSLKSSTTIKRLSLGKDDIVDDHVIDGLNIVPGAYMIEQGYKALKEIEGSLTRLSNIVIQKPGIVNNSIDIKVETNTDDNKFYIKHNNDLLCSGSYSKDKNTYIYKKLPQIKEKNCVVESNEVYNKLFYNAGYAYGESLQLIEAVQENEHYYVIKIKEHNKSNNDFNAFMLDGIFQSALLSVFLNQDIDLDSDLYVPYIVSEIDLTSSFSEIRYITIEKKSIVRFQNNMKLSLEVYNKHGEGVMNIQELVFAKTNKKNKNLLSKKTSFAQEAWIEKSLSQERDESHNKVAIVFANDTYSQEELKPFYENHNKVIIVNKGMGFSYNNDFYEVNINDESDFVSLMNSIEDKYKNVELSVYYLWMYEYNNGSNIEQYKEFEVFEQHLKSFFYFIKTLSIKSYSLNSKVKLVIPIKNTFIISQDDEGVGSMNSVLKGIIKSLKQENSSIDICLVDFRNNDDTIIRNIIKENLHNRNDITVGYRNNKRFVQQVIHNTYNLSQDNSILRPDGVYIVIGGHGGIGRGIVEAVLKQNKCYVVIVGRSPSDFYIEKWINSLGSNKENITYYQKDISNKEDVKSLIDTVKKRYGRINGVIHLGGVLEDKLLSNKQWDSFRRTLIPKIKGTLLLDYFTRNDKLDFFIVFSSIVSVFGNIGQTDYAAANSFLDDFMRYRAKSSSHGKSLSINWPLWSDIGMGESKEAFKNFEARKIHPITYMEGIKIFEQILFAKDLPEQIIVEKQEDNMLKENSKYVSTSIDKKNNSMLGKDLEEYLSTTVSTYLGVNSEDISEEESFFSLGLDSVVLQEIMTELNKKFDNLPPTLLFDYPNMKKLLISLRDKIEKGQINTKEPFDTKENNNINNDTETNNYEDEKTKAFEEVYNVLENKESNGYNIAIIGINGRFPKASTIHEFWKNLLDGKDCTQEIPIERWDYTKYYSNNHGTEATTYGKWGAFIDDVDKFDPLFFGISPKEAEEMDPQQRILLETVWKTMEDAGYGDKDTYENKTIGHYTGVMWNEYSFITSQEGFQKDRYVGPGSIYWAIANRVSYVMGFRGPSIAIDTACSSSLTAIHLACQGILNGDCDMAVAGGINLSIHPAKYVYLAQAGFLSKDGLCRSFGDNATGYVPGEGVGAVLLKPLEQALKDNDNIYGVIKGSSVNHGGKSANFTIPNSEAHKNLIVQAVERASVSIEDISYVECQGTGTALGDPIEINGLSNAFNCYTNKKQFCPIGSVKSNIGHLEAAGGIAGVIKVLLAMKHKVIPKNLHSEIKNPNIDFTKTPFYVADEALNWDVPNSKKRIAGVSSFGAGGANAHLIIEEFEEIKKSLSNESNRVLELILISAKNKQRLEEYLKSFYAYLSNGLMDEYSLKDIAYTLQVGRRDFEERIAIIAKDKQELLTKLNSIINENIDIENVFRGNIKVKNYKSINNERSLEDRSDINNLLEEYNLHKIAYLWTLGIKFDWKVLNRNHICNKVSLCTYPFERKRYWIECSDTYNNPSVLNQVQEVSENSFCYKEEKRETMNEAVVNNEKNNDKEALCVFVQNWLTHQVSQILKVPLDDIYINDDISDYGFDSMSYTDFAEKTNNKYNTDITPAIFFEHSTILSFAEYLCDKHYDCVSTIHQIDMQKETISNKQVNKTLNEDIVKNTSKPYNEEFSFKQNEKQYGEREEEQYKQKYEEEYIAIIGMSGKFPQSDNLDEYWENLMNQKNMISEIPKERWNWEDYYGDPIIEAGKSNIKWGGFIDDVYKFDAGFFGISRREAELMDPQQRMIMETVWETIEDSGYKSSELWGSNTGVFVGVATSDYTEILSRNKKAVEAHTSTGVLNSILPNRVSYFYNFHGPSECIDTACSSSLVAVDSAVNAIKNGSCEIAIASGVSALLTPTLFISFNKAGMLSLDGRCKTFDENANGYVRGEGCGAVLLKSYKKAIKDNNHIYGIIRSSKINHGGRANSMTAPNPNAQADLLVSAYKQAKIGTDKIGYIETHGTGTSLGDPIEINSLKKAFEELNNSSKPESINDNHCILGAVKTNIGHLEGAAGIAGLLKVLLCLKHKKIPSNINFNKLNPYISLEDSPFVLANKPYAFNSIKDKYGNTQPRVAGVSSFGVGGVNSHIVIEEYINEAKVNETIEQPHYLIVFSAKTEASLQLYLNKFLKWLDGEGEQCSLGDIAHMLLVRKNHFSIRYGFVASNKNEIKQIIKSILEKSENKQYFEGVVKKNSPKSEHIYSEFGSHIIDKLSEEEYSNVDENKEKLMLLADLFVKGYLLDWSKLYNHKDYKCISLPTYVFERKSYGSEKNKETIQENVTIQKTNVLHPLIDCNESTLDLQSFKKKLEEKAFYIKDHVIGEEKILPGVVYLEMAMIAGNLSNPKSKVKRIHNTIFTNPVVVSDYGKEITINIKQSHKEISYSVSSTVEDNRKIIHAQGKLDYEASSRLVNDEYYIDIEEIKNRCKYLKTNAECYHDFGLRDLNYGASFQTIKQLHYNKDEALALIKLKNENEKDFSQYIFFPTIMDGVLQTALELMKKHGNNDTYIPFSIGDVQLIKNLTKQCYAYARYSNNHNNSEILMFDIDLTDELGNILVSMKDVAFKQQNSKLEQNLTTLYLKNQWVPQELRSEHSLGIRLKDVIVFDYDEEFYKQFKNSNAIKQVGRMILVKKGEQCRLLGDCVYEVNPYDENSYNELIELFINNNVTPSTIVHLWSKNLCTNYSKYEDDKLVNSFYSLFYLSKALLNKKTNNKISFIYVHELENNSIIPFYGAISAYLKTLVLENINITYKSIGLPTSKSQYYLESILNEIYIQEDKFRDVCYFGEHRFVKVLNEINIDKNKNENIDIKEHGVYLITGGNGGLGLVFARFLLEEYHAKVILVGRSELEEDKKLSLKRLNGEAIYIKCDISKEEDLEYLLDSIHTKYKQLNGIIHSAGVIRDSYIINKEKQHVNEVFLPKIYGLGLLDKVFKDEKLDFIVLFSSITSLLGNLGQADYSYANSYMDFFAKQRQELYKQGERFGKTLSINWPLWKRGGMMVDKKMIQLIETSMGVKAIDTNEGILAFKHGIASDESQLLVAKGHRSRLQKLTEKPKSKKTSLNGNIQVDNSEEVLELFQQWIITQISDILMVDSSDLNIDDDMREYGFDSVLLTELANRINTGYDLDILPPVFFEYSSIKALSEYLCEKNLSNITNVHKKDLKHIKQVIEETFVEQYEDEYEDADESTLLDIEKVTTYRDYEQVQTNSNNRSMKKEDVAIVGISAVMPQSEDISEFWKNLVDGKDLISEIPKERWDWKQYYGDPMLEQGKTNVKWGGFMKEIDKFDASFFGISPREAEIMDPQHRIFLQLVWKAVEDAGYKMSDLWGSKTGLFVGVSTSDYSDIMKEKGIPIEAHTSTGGCHSILANRISYLFNLKGPSEPVDTACSSSLVAIHRAVEAIRSGSCDKAIAGGVSVLLSPSLYISFNKAGMLSPDGRCKTFDKKANGYARGEGSGAVLLKPLSKAIADGDNIYGVIKGSVINHQGRSNSLTAPNPNSQAELLVQAYDEAGVLPNKVGFIEAHGTGTSLGDPIEINGLKKAFTELYEKHGLEFDNKPYCALGTVKTNIGHLEAAAGIAGLIKVLLVMKYKKIPCNPNFEELNPYIQLEQTPFYIPKKIEKWEAFKNSEGIELPRVAGISSFGFGGVNAHVVIEEYNNSDNDTNESNMLTPNQQLIILSAKSEEQLKTYAESMLQYADNINALSRSVSLSQIAYTLQVGREPMEHKLAFVASTIEQMKEKLSQYCSGDSSSKGILRGYKKEDNNEMLLIDGEEGKQYINLLIKNKKLLKLGQIWVSGIDIDWCLLYPNPLLKAIDLPTYPFEKQRYWFEENIINSKNNSKEGVSMKESGYVKKMKLKKLDSVSPQSIKPLDEVIQPEKTIVVKNLNINTTKGDKSAIIKKTLKALLAETLHVKADTINDNSPFIEQGLDSILVLEFVKKINREFNTDFKAVRVYDYSTINTLTDFLNSTIDVPLEIEDTKESEDFIENPINLQDLYSINKIESVEEQKKSDCLEEKKNSINGCKDIAVIGISGKFPGAKNVEEYWKNLKNGTSSIIEVPSNRWDINKFYNSDTKDGMSTYCKWGGFLEDVDKFDPLFFNISPTEAELMDPQQRLFLEQAWSALEDAGYSAKTLNAIKCGVYVGSMGNDYNEILATDSNNMNQAQAMTGNANSILASRIAYLLNLKGPAIQLDTACSSSLIATHLAIQSLVNKEADMMLAGGVSVYLTENSYVKMNNAGMLSKQGKCKTFDKDADGFVPGEAVGVVVLKLLEKAVEDNDNIYGIIKGSAINQDGKTNGITAPSAESQKALEVEVYNKYDINPETISYIETHGTGTKLGDPIEVQALNDAFRCFTKKKQFCGIGSVKTNIGHTSAASGVSSLIKVLLSFKYKQIPPSLNFMEENDNIDLADTPFYVNTTVKDWTSSIPRRAAVSSFGFSGTNAHMVLEEYIDSKNYKEDTRNDSYVVPISARSIEQLSEYTQNILSFLEKNNNIDLRNMAYTLQVGRTAMEKRIAIVASNINELKQKLIKYSNNKDIEAFNSDYEDKLSYIVDEENLDKIAQKWVKGEDIDWQYLYKNKKLPKLISLPTYPFKKNSYWIDRKITKNCDSSFDKTYPLIEKLDSAMSLEENGLVFTSHIYKSNRIITDHQVKGRSLFPGMGCLEMVLEAVNMISMKDEYEINRIAWVSPLWIDENKKEIKTIITKHESNIGFEIKSKPNGSNQYITHAEGVLSKIAKTPKQMLDSLSIEDIKARCEDYTNKDVLYNSYINRGIVYGKYLSIVQHVYSNKHEAIGRISLPLELKKELSDYIIHPVILDSALQCISALELNEENSITDVPFSIGKVEMLNPIKGQVYSYVRRKNETQKRYDVDVLDEKGAICIRLHDVSLRPLSDSLGRIFYEPKWVEKSEKSEKQWNNEEINNKQNVLILYPPTLKGLEQSIKEEYLKKGAKVTLLKLGEKTCCHENEYEIDIKDKNSFVNLINRLNDITCIYFLGDIDSYSSLSKGNDKAFDKLEERGVISLFRLAKALSDNGYSSRFIELKVITNNSYRILDNEKINPFGSSLIGFSRALNNEFYNWKVSCIDISTQNQHIDMNYIVKSLLYNTASSENIQLAIRDEKYYERVLQPINLQPVNQGESKFRHKGVYFVVGGAGGIGLELCKYLCSKYSARIVLIGRSVLDKKQIDDIEKIEELGGHILYIQADITDYNSISDAVYKTKEYFGSINGVIHSAIVLKDKIINNMSEDMLREVLSPKVLGSVVLDHAFRDEELDFIMFFSSAESFLCQAGQSNYSSASTFKDAYANYLQQLRSYPVKIINWGYWGSVGIVSNKEYNEHLAKEGIYSIEPVEGMEAIERILTQEMGLSQVAVLKAKENVLNQLNVKSKISEISSNVSFDNHNMMKDDNNEMAFNEVDEWCKYMLLNVFQKIGVFIRRNERYTKLDLMNRLGIIEQYSRLLDTVLDILINAGFLEVDQSLEEGIITTSQLIDTLNNKDILKSLDVWKEQITKEFPYVIPHMNLVHICLNNYLEILTGRKHHMEVMFPGGSMSMMEGIYSGYPIADNLNLSVAKNVKKYIKKTLEHNSKAVIKIVELGAGTGSTSKLVLEAIKQYSNNLKYYYTDISSGFIEYGKKEYKEEYPFVEFKVLDIENTMDINEWDKNSIDILFATNVIHATKQIGETLENMKKLLGTNGIIIINEATKRHNFIDLTFGLTEGWWRFEDKQNRLEHSPLLSESLWKNVIEQKGLKHLRTISYSDKKEDSTQCVMIGQNNSEADNNIEQNSIEHTKKDVLKRMKQLLKNESEVNNTELADEKLMIKTLRFVKEVFSQVLKINETEIDNNTTFERYGVDSLVGLKIIKLFEDSFDKLPSTLLFEYMTVEKLADYFIEHHRDTLKRKLGFEDYEESQKVKTLDKAININIPKTSIDKEIIDLNSVKDNLIVENKPIIKEDDIAIIGVSGIYPGADNIEEFWEKIKNAENCISEVPLDRWNWKDYKDSIDSKWGGFIKDVDKFDSLTFQMTAKDSENMDPQARLFLETAWNAIEDAGYTNEVFDKIDREVGVFVGVMNNNYEFISGEAYGKGQVTEAHSSYWVIPNRVSYRFDFYGPSLAVDTACSSSLTSIHLACESLKRDECKIAIAGGVNLILHPVHYKRLSKMNMITSDNKCKSFGEGADGFVDGEGVGAVILKPLNQAILDKDNIYAVIKGSSINAGGKTSGFTVPNPIAQGKVISKAYKRTGIDPRTISYVEAHGTGTSLGDPIEIKGLTRAFKEYTKTNNYCAIGSLKSNIGHLESAAGIAGLTKIIMQMKHKQLVASINCEVLNPKIDFDDSPFYVQKELSEWKPPVIMENGEKVIYPRRAGISSFGAGGGNAHLIVEEYLPSSSKLKNNMQKHDKKIASTQLVVLSAKNKESLKIYTKRILESIKKQSSGEILLSNLAYTLQVGREHMKERLAIVTDNLNDLCSKLSLYCEGENNIERLFKGNTKDDKKILEVLFDGNDGAEILDYIVNSKNLEKIAQIWIAGGKISWSKLHDEEQPMRISLPVHPLMKSRYWINSVKSTYNIEENNDTNLKERHVAIKDKRDIGDIEKKLCNMVASILKIEQSKIDLEMEMNLEYFDSMELIMMISKEYGNHFDPTTIANCKSVKEILDYIERTKKSKKQPKQLEATKVQNIVNNKQEEITVENVRIKVVAIVAKMLNTEETEIDVDTDISEYGLNSINVMLMHHKLQEAFGEKIEPMMIVDNRTIAELASYLVNNKII